LTQCARANETKFYFLEIFVISPQPQKNENLILEIFYPYGNKYSYLYFADHGYAATGERALDNGLSAGCANEVGGKPAGGCGEVWHTRQSLISLKFSTRSV
jgi:hypothetical protein